MTLTETRVLDDVGWAILGELQRDARIGFAELGRKVGLSAPAVAERVRRLEDAGVIRGYRADLDLSKLGYHLLAIIRVTVDNPREDAFVRFVQDLPEVLACDRVTGTDCSVLRVAVRDVPHLDDVIRKIKPYGSPITSLVLSSPVESRLVGKP